MPSSQFPYEVILNVSVYILFQRSYGLLMIFKTGTHSFRRAWNPADWMFTDNLMK